MLAQADFREKYEAWLERIGQAHHGKNHRTNPEPAFTTLVKPLAECRVALVTTAGAHLAHQEPFHTATVAGDSTYRIIPDDADLSSLRFSHTHYDTTSAEKDPNVVLPITRLRELAQGGRIGEPSPIHIGMMGFNPDPTMVADRTAPAVAEALKGAGVDVAILAPG